MTDRIAVTGIEVFARHGVLQSEQEQGQIFSIDVEMELDLASAAASDHLEDTVDYGLLAEQVAATVGGERWNLIERVADRVAGLVMADERVTATTVTVHKPQAPIEVPFGDVSVTVHRAR